jgi:transcription antitermination protein NusB
VSSPRQTSEPTNGERRTGPRPRRESRRQAREAAVQMLYQWEVGKQSMLDVMQTYWTTPGLTDDEPLADDQRQFATTLTNGVAATVEQLDPMIAEAAQNWRLERMAIMDRIILRLAVYEFLHQPETPARVIINEALELARTFSTDDAVRFINGMLDGIRRTLARE